MDYAYLDNISFLRHLGVYAPELLTPDQASDLVRDISLNFGFKA